MPALELEQKFVLDPTKADDIMHLLVDKAVHGDSHRYIHIEQFYDKSGERFRCTTGGGKVRCVRESKKSIKIGTSYSINSEIETEITQPEFDAGWQKNPNRRLQKTRFEFPSDQIDHKIMVDFFYTKDSQGSKSIYAIIAEDETMISRETESLYLRFDLPIYLNGYCLLRVDDANPEHKIFKSTNMVDTPDAIEAVKKAIRRLNESV